MTAHITEILMGLGSFEVAFKHDAELVDAFPLYDHALFYEGEELIYTGVIVGRQPKRGATIRGFGIDWWLGKESDGPVIEDREYIAGTNKLSNGGFEDGDLLWRLDESTAWEIRSTPGEPYAGEWAAAIVGTPTDDEVLQSDETFECRPGDQHRCTVRINRVSGDVGRVRLRLVYEGRFRHPNLLAAATYTDISTYDADAVDDGTYLVLGPVTQRQSIHNDSFEDEGAPGPHWYDQDAKGYATEDFGDLPIGYFQGDIAMVLPAYGAGGAILLYDDDAGATPPLEPISVAPGERILLQFAVNAYAADGVTHADGRVYAGVLLTDVDDLNPVFFATDQLDVDSIPTAAWTLVSTEFDVPDERVRAHPFIQAYDVTVGAWAFDAFTFTHLERNEAAMRASDVNSQTPERRYKLIAPVTSDASVSDGNLKVRIRFTSSLRDPVIVESPTMEPTGGQEQLLVFEYEPPSGYVTAKIEFVATDVKGGAFRIRKSGISLRYDDPNTKIRETRSNGSTAGWEQLTFNSDAPAGSERYHLELIAESEADGWVVDDVTLNRREAPDVVTDIVAELLRSPTTDEPIVPAGTIHAAGALLYDWRVRNMTDREALKHLSTSGLLVGPREWRVRPDPVVDWGTAEELFVDRTGFVLTENDLTLRDAPTAVDDVSERLTAVKIIGADRTPVGGRKQIITGQAVGASDAVDWFGRPIERTRIVEDSTVDTLPFANDRAAYELERNTNPANTVHLDVSDWRTAGRFDVGDWIYAYVPAAELVDGTYTQQWQGRTIAPSRKRVISRTRKLGAGQFRLELRAADGSVRDVTEFVQWENETAADIELGDARPEFALDPQGGAAGAQFRRYRGSTGL